MSIFGNIMAKIFHHDGAAAPVDAHAVSDIGRSAQAGTQLSAGAAPQNAARPSTPVSSASAGVASTTTSQDAAPRIAQNDNPTASTTGAASVDVGQVMEGLAAKSSEKLDWKHSIVDMMKLLGLDSSLTARQELAKELAYSGDMHDSASMNVWLHRQVMQKLAANGGKVPDDLRV